MYKKTANLVFRKRFIFGFSVVLFLLLVLYILVIMGFFDTPSTTNNECGIEKRDEIVQGNSLDPFIKNGETVKALYHFYDCNQVNRMDVVLYDYAGSSNPIVKTVYAVPGEELSLQKNEDGWNILVNKKVLKNRSGHPFLISQQGYRMLSLYEGTLRADAYLILGENPSGSTDSTRFGLIGKQDILGKVEIEGGQK